jgi:hypothetical protein
VEGVLSLVPIFNLLVILLYVCTMIGAATFGRKAERLAAALLTANMALTWAAQASGDRAPFFAFMAIDLLTAAGLAYIMVKNPDKLWPGVSACAQLLIFVFSATRAIEFPLSEQSYLVMLNFCSLLCIGALAAGTWAARRTPVQGLAAA